MPITDITKTKWHYIAIFLVPLILISLDLHFEISKNVIFFEPLGMWIFLLYFIPSFILIAFLPTDAFEKIMTMFTVMGVDIFPAFMLWAIFTCSRVGECF